MRHLLPNTAGPALAQFSINCAWSLQVVTGLAFLGLGVEVPEAEWGLMVQHGSHYLVTGEWWVSFFPGMAIVGAVYGFRTTRIDRPGLGRLPLRSALAFLLAGAACAPWTPPSTDENAKSVLTVGVPDDVTTLDSVFASADRSLEVIMNCYEPLMTHAWKDARFVPGELVGGALEDVSVAEDGQSWTLSVRRGVRFPGGGEVTARVREAAFRAQLLRSGLGRTVRPPGDRKGRGHGIDRGDGRIRAPREDRGAESSLRPHPRSLERDSLRSGAPREK